jgi:hypothetical protein
MNVSGKSTALPLAAATTGQAVPARPGAAGPSTSAAAPAGRPRDLSPRTKAQIDHARQAFNLRTAYVKLQARGQLQDADPNDLAQRASIRAAARQEIHRQSQELDRTVHRIVHPPQRPASNEPAQRIVGFDVKPAP